MTLILRMKFTGIPNMGRVMDYVAENLKVLINGVLEEKLTNGVNRFAKHNFIASSDWKKD